MTSLLSNIITLHIVIKSICNWIMLMVFRFTEKDMNIACIDTATPFWEQAKNIYAETKMLTSFRSGNLKTPICISADFPVLYLTTINQILKQAHFSQCCFITRYSWKGKVCIYFQSIHALWKRKYLLLHSFEKEKKINLGRQIFSQICWS